MKYTYYATTHHLSRAMGEAIAEGFGARLMPVSSYVYDGSTAIVYGILRGCGRIMERCEAESLPYIYVDHAYFFQNRGVIDNPRPDAYFRLVRNGRYCHHRPAKSTARWDALGLSVLPFHRQGQKIVVVPVSRYVADFEQMDAATWLDDIVQELAGYTDRDIVIKPKSGIGIEGLDELFADAHALVAHDSVSAISALMHGVPVFVSQNNPARKLGRGLEKLLEIEEPYYPEDRIERFAGLAAQQWTVEEIKNGTARRYMEAENA